MCCTYNTLYLQFATITFQQDNVRAPLRAVQVVQNPIYKEIVRNPVTFVQVINIYIYIYIPSLSN